MVGVGERNAGWGGGERRGRRKLCEARRRATRLGDAPSFRASSPPHTRPTSAPLSPPTQPLATHQNTAPTPPPGLAATRSFPSFGSLASLDTACLALLDPAPSTAAPPCPADLAPLFCEWTADTVAADGGKSLPPPLPPSGAVAPLPAGDSDADSPPPSPKRVGVWVEPSPATPRLCGGGAGRRHGTPASCDGDRALPPAKRARPERRRARPSRYEA